MAEHYIDASEGTGTLGPNLDAWLTAHAGLKPEATKAKAERLAIKCLCDGRLSAAQYAELLKADAQWRLDQHAAKGPAQAAEVARLRATMATKDLAAVDDDPIIDRLGNLERDFDASKMPRIDPRTFDAPRRGLILTDAQIKHYDALLENRIARAVDRIGIKPAVGAVHHRSAGGGAEQALTTTHKARDTQKAIADTALRSFNFPSENIDLE